MENVYLCSVNGALRMRPTNERKRISIVEMKMSEQTLQQVERALRKVAAKFPTTSGHTPLTDIYLQVTPESGELRAYDDDDVELTRCVVEEWIDYRGEDFYEVAEQVGYKDITYFSSTFKKLVGVSPSEYQDTSL